jgi:hypothetical protein
MEQKESGLSGIEMEQKESGLSGIEMEHKSLDCQELKWNTRVWIVRN